MEKVATLLESQGLTITHSPQTLSPPPILLLGTVLTVRATQPRLHSHGASKRFILLSVVHRHIRVRFPAHFPRLFFETLPPLQTIPAILTCSSLQEQNPMRGRTVLLVLPVDSTVTGAY